MTQKNRKTMGIVRRNKRFIDVVREKGGVNILGKTIPPFVFDYLREHPNEKMYIGKNVSTIDKIYNDALKWQNKNNKI